MKGPVRVIEGNAKPFERFWIVKNEEGGDPELDFYGAISEYALFDDDITPRMFKEDLYSLGKGGPVTVHIDSPGGAVDAASTIRAIMMDYPGIITIKIDGLCASAAVVVALAGDRVLMQESGYMMIHDPMTIAFGNERDLKTAIQSLEAVKSGILDCYQTKTGMDRGKLDSMMSKETWMSARDALEFGFVDELITSGSAKASNLPTTAIVNCLRNYVHVPANIFPMPESNEQQDPAEPGQVDEVKEREVKNLRDYLDVFAKGAK